MPSRNTATSHSAQAPPDGGASAEASPRLTTELSGSLAALAVNTGGLQAYWSNDLTRLLPRLLEDSRQYYRIAYAQPDAPAGKKQPPSRRIKVQVARDGVNVRSRQRYAPVNGT